MRVLSTKCTSARFGLYGAHAYALRVMRVLSTKCTSARLWTGIARRALPRAAPARRAPARRARAEP